jgi:acetyl esterase/lipase
MSISPSRGDTFPTDLGIDPNLARPTFMTTNQFYAGGADLTDPYVSPLFADFQRGFPPTFLA